MSGALAAAAQRLRALHRADEVLVLPNCWDVASARRLTEAGASAAATSSAAVAESLGFADHEHAPADAMLAAVARIAAAVDVPVTADLEAGYGLSAAALVDALLAAGAVGLNLEDTDHAGGGLRPVGAQAERIAAVKAAGRAAGVDVVLNARVDVHLPAHGAALEEGLARARAYREAGADCVYPILVVGDEAIAAYVQTAGVVNVLATTGGPPLARLRELGVARVSFGPRVWWAALDAGVALWRDFVTEA